MRILTSFIGFFLAIVVTIFVVAPERLPVGYGFEPIPIELVIESSFAGQLVETVTGNSGKNLILRNSSSGPINNLTVTLLDGKQKVKHQYISHIMPAAEEVTLGWARKWSIQQGDTLEVKASAYYKVVWAL